MTKTAYIISGANGSGKTTFAKGLSEQLSLAFLNADEIAKEIDPSNTIGGEIAAGRIFFQRLNKIIISDQSFVLESTLSGRYLLKLIEKLRVKGYRIELLYIFLENPDVCIERIKERVLNGGHFVPDEAVIRRYFRSKDNFWNVYKALVDKWFLIYNSEFAFKEFCIGNKEGYTVLEQESFDNFMNGIEVK